MQLPRSVDPMSAIPRTVARRRCCRRTPGEYQQRKHQPREGQYESRLLISRLSPAFASGRKCKYRRLTLPENLVLLARTIPTVSFTAQDEQGKFEEIRLPQKAREYTKSQRNVLSCASLCFSWRSFLHTLEAARQRCLDTQSSGPWRAAGQSSFPNCLK